MEKMLLSDSEDRCGGCGNTIAHCGCDGGLEEGEPDPFFDDME